MGDMGPSVGVALALGMRIGGAGFGHAHKRDWLLGMRSCLSGALLAFLRSGLVRG